MQGAGGGARAGRPNESQWLGLGDAARYLGVHYTTLRRWADAGKVSCVRTPGGQRRFARAHLDGVLGQAPETGASNSLVALQDVALGHARRELKLHGIEHQSWVASFGAAQQDRFRQRGRHLVSLLLHYTSCGHAGAAFLDEASAICQEHGAACRRAGLSITEALSAVLFFQHSFLELADEAGLSGSTPNLESSRLRQRIGDFLGAALLAAAAGYCDVDALPSPPAGCPQPAQ